MGRRIGASWLGLGLVLGLLWTGVAAASLGSNDRALEAIGAKDPGEGDFSFLVVGDSRGPRSRFPQVAARMRPVSGDFVLHLGDLTNRGTSKEYQEIQRELDSLGRPVLAVIGNHELVDRGRGRYALRFGSNVDGAFRYGGGLFVFFDNADGRPLGEKRLAWLRSVLEEGRDLRFRLVFCHQPLYDPRKGQEVSGHSMDPRGAAELREVFREGKVTRVFASHVHGWYEGTWGGVPFTVTGGGGAHLYDKDPAHGFFHFLRVDVAGSEVTVRVFPVEAR